MDWIKLVGRSDFTIEAKYSFKDVLESIYEKEIRKDLNFKFNSKDFKIKKFIKERKKFADNTFDWPFPGSYENEKLHIGNDDEFWLNHGYQIHCILPDGRKVYRRIRYEITLDCCVPVYMFKIFYKNKEVAESEHYNDYAGRRADTEYMKEIVWIEVINEIRKCIKEAEKGEFLPHIFNRLLEKEKDLRYSEKVKKLPEKLQYDNNFKPRKIFTYFIGNKEQNRIKIGISSNPQSRLSGLQTGCPFPLEIFKIFAGNREESLHKRFKKHRIFLDGKPTEWFKFDKEIKDFIEAA